MSESAVDEVDVLGVRRRQTHWKRRFLQAGLLLLGLLVFFLWITNVSTEITTEDLAVFENDLDLKDIPRPLTYEDEIRTIRLVQARVFAKAPLGKGIPGYEPREPSDLMRYGRGLCYDRSRTFDKVFDHLGFKTRHVFLLYRKEHSFIASLFLRGHPSHAVTEVLTRRGWLYVDSNQPWIAVNRQGDPVGAGGIWKRFDEFDSPPAYVQGPWWAIRGLYSRKGHFYAPYFPLPQVNWADFLEWVLTRD